MKTIKCICGQDIWLDDSDFDRVNDIGIYCNNKGVYTKINGEYFSVASFILGKQQGFIIDHKDRNGHNNQRDNFRYATIQQNNCNNGLRKDNKTGFKGVSFNKTLNKFVAVIQYNGRQKHIGCFYTAQEAACAYDEKAKELHGEFAFVNFPNGNNNISEFV